MESRSRLTNYLKQKYPKNVYIEIFSFLKEEDHTVNGNGIFFNLSDIPDDKIEKCNSYIEMLTTNVEDHFKNLSLRETIETRYKTDISKKKNETKAKNTKRETEAPEILLKKKEFTGVFKRIDRILRGLKPTPLKKDKKSEDLEEDLDEQEEEVEATEAPLDDDDDNLFGDDSDSDINSEI